MTALREFASAGDLRRWLAGQGVDLTAWGRGGHKSVDHLWDEIERGETQIQEEPLLRLVDVVQVVVRRGERALIETEQELVGGGRRRRNRPPSEKMQPGESYLEAALRCLREELGVKRSDVTLLHDTYRRKQRDAPSPSYPGLHTRYTFHQVEAEVEGLPEGAFSTHERAGERGDPVETHHWTWEEKG